MEHLKNVRFYVCMEKEFKNNFENDTLGYGWNVIAHGESLGSCKMKVLEGNDIEEMSKPTVKV